MSETTLIPAPNTPNMQGLTTLATHRPPELLSMLHQDYDGPLVIGSLDLTSPEGKEWWLAASAGADIDRDMGAQEWFPVQAWTAEYAENISSEEGDAKPGVRVTLYTPTGSTFSFSGLVPHQSFRKILALYGNGPWHTPLYFNVRPFTTSNKRQTYVLVAREKGPQS